MATIPLPALGIRPPEQQPGVLDNAAKVIQLKNLMQAGNFQAQNQPLQLEAARQENQVRATQIAQTAALNKSYANAVKMSADGTPQIDTGSLMKSLTANNAGAAIPGAIESVTKYNKTLVDLKTAQTDLQSKSNDLIGHAASAIQKAGYDPQLAHTLLDTLPQTPQLNAFRAKIDDPAQLKQLVDSAIANSPKEREIAAQEQTAKSRADAAKTGAERLAAELPGGALSPAAKESQRIAAENSPEAIAGAARKAAAETAARQTAAQGDPNTAGHMLANGSLTLADLKSRGTTPQFITQAVAAAQKEKSDYNPADEVIAESVAKSQGANQFFGSANSLIAKGGTLDQLEAQGKKIPNEKLPILNTFEDWQQLAKGKGPLAGYAATALGVADDYGKVMGGGTASDHARDAALRLFAAASSPEMRADAIKATRDAVGSQRDSRIGNNQFLRRLYGDQPSKGGDANNAQAASAQVPANVAAVLKGAGAGRHILSDGTVWDKRADGSVIRVTKAP